MNDIAPAVTSPKTSASVKAPLFFSAATWRLIRKALVLFICGAVPWVAILWALGVI